MNNKRNIDTIDLLKGFAILAVIYLHSGFTIKTSRLLLSPFTFNLAVPIFMIVSGYTYSISLSKFNNESVLKSYYTPKNIYKKLIRILPCYLIIFALELILQPYNFAKNGILHFAYTLCTGGYLFPGSYYIPILVELILIFPFLKIIYDKLKSKSFILIGIIQIIYELAIYYLNIPDKFTRLLIVRYLVFILGGIFIFDKYKSKEFKHKWIYFVSFILGFLYIVAIGYLDFTPKILFSKWTNTSMPTALYLIPVMLLIFIKFSDKKCNTIFKILGKASYHIYLFQMIYFGVIINKLTIKSSLANYIYAVAFSVICGLIMYFIENKIITAFRKNA